MTSSSYSTACLCLLLQGLPLISPVITSPDVWRRIAFSIVNFTKTQTQSSNGVGMSPVDTENKKVDDLLVSSPYIEIRSLHTQEALFQARQMWPKTYVILCVLDFFINIFFASFFIVKSDNQAYLTYATGFSE